MQGVREGCVLRMKGFGREKERRRDILEGCVIDEECGRPGFWKGVFWMKNK